MHHKTKIQWPVILVFNEKTGIYTALLKGMEGVIAQGNSPENAISELTISLQVMVKQLSLDDSLDDGSDALCQIDGIKKQESNLFLEMA